MELRLDASRVCAMCVPERNTMANQIKLTKRSVDALRPTGKRFTVMDTDLKGFCLRVSTSGGKVYGFRYRVGGGRSGRQRWLSIGKHGNLTPDQAREMARTWAMQVAGGGDPALERQTKRAAPTVSQLLDRYVSEHVERKNKPSTARNIRNQIKRDIHPALGRLKVADVSRADISRFHVGLGATPYAANRALALLSKLFGLAEVWGLRPDHSNPCMRVQRFEEKSRERFLSAAEFAVLGDVLSKAETAPLTIAGQSRQIRVNPQAIHAIRLLIFTGARVGEILGLRWAWINWEMQRAELPESKTGKKHIHLPPTALALLRSLERPDDGQGFVIRGGDGLDPENALVNIKDPWNSIRIAAGLKGVRLHDLRHSFASTAVAGGMSLPMIGALLGHRDVKTTARYAHLSDDPLREAAAQIGNRIASAMQGQTDGAKVIPFHQNS